MECSSVGPSPVYAEPWDALTSDLGVVTSSDGVRCSTGVPSFRRNTGGRSRRLHRNDGGSDKRDRKAVVSSGYRVPLDAVRLDVDSSSDIARRPKMPPLPPPPPVPPPPLDEPLAISQREAATHSIDIDDEPLMVSIGSVPLRKRSVNVRRQKGDELTRFFVSVLGNVDVEKQVSKGTSADSVSSSSAFQLVDPVDSGVDDETRRTRSPDRQHGYRSDYDNMSEDDVSREFGQYDDSGDELPVARSRLMTGSSMRTEYSPPWDGSRWHQLFTVSDGNNNVKLVTEIHKLQTKSPPSDWRLESTGYDVSNSSSWDIVNATPSRPATAPKSANMELMFANSNLMYCDRSLQRRSDSRASTLTRFSSSSMAALDDLELGVVSSDCASAAVVMARRSSAVNRDSATQDQRRNQTGIVSNGTLDRRRDLPSVIEWTTANSSVVTTTMTASRPPRCPISRQASSVAPAAAVVGTSIVTRGLSTPSSTMLRTTAGDEWTPQKSPDVIPLIASPRLVSPRYRGHFHPAAQISDFIVRLTKAKQESKLGTLVNNFIQCTVNGRETNPRKVVSNVRQFMNGMKNFLSFRGEPELDKFINSIRSELLESNAVHIVMQLDHMASNTGACSVTQMKPSECLNLDAVIEIALIKCTIKPLKEHIYRLFEYEYTRNGNLQMLSEGLKAFHTAGLSPSPEVIASVDEVSVFLTMMEKSYSPLTKLENLLSAVATISETFQTKLLDNETLPKRPQTSPVTADELLSSTVAILVERNMLSAEIEADYMWGLIHPSFLTGDARISTNRVRDYPGSRLSAQAQFIMKLICAIVEDATTATPSGGVDGFVTVTTVDERNDTVVRHSLPVFPEMAAKNICSMLAHRLRITNPQDYGLYTVCAGLDKRMAEDEKIQPQSSKSSIKLNQRSNKFVYKRLDAHFVWPECMINCD